MLSFLLSDFGLSDRKTLRPANKQQPNFHEKYDAKVFLYDIFFSAGKFVLIGPCLTLEAREFLKEKLTINGEQILLGNYFFDSLKCFKLLIDGEPSDLLELDGRPMLITEQCKAFAELGPRFVYTLQKDNEIEWIEDWIDWYVRRHNATGILVYDNGSEKYDSLELSARIARRDCNVVVQPFPFIYGPGAFDGSNWDSDYCQYGALEHARYFFGRRAMMLNADIDELIVSEKSAFEELLDRQQDVLFFKGAWAHCDTKMSDSNQNIRHRSHEYFDAETSCPPKWVANLQGLPDDSFLSVHTVSGGVGWNRAFSLKGRYIHFRGISNGWKYQRHSNIVDIESSVHCQGGVDKLIFT